MTELEAVASLFGVTFTPRKAAPFDSCPGSGAPIVCGGVVVCFCGYQIPADSAEEFNASLKFAFARIGYRNIGPSNNRTVPVHRRGPA